MVEPAKGAIINYLQIVFSYILSFGILGEKIEINGIIGSLMILSNTIFIFIKNRENTT